MQESDEARRAAAALTALSRRSAVLAAAGAAMAAAGAAAREAPAGPGFLPGRRSLDGLDLPDALAGVPLDPGAGFGLDLAPFTAWIIPRAGLLGPDGDPSLLREKRLPAGAIVTCLGEVWWLESAPDSGDGITLTAWAEGVGDDGPEAMLTGEASIGPAGVSALLMTPAELRGSARNDQIVARLSVGPDGQWNGGVEVRNSDLKHGPCYKRCKDNEGQVARRCRRNCKHHQQRKRRRKHHRHGNGS